MKITKLTTFVVPPRWLFLKIETDEGITGWGEPVVEGRAETVAACVAELADYLVGKDPCADRGPLDGALSRRFLPRRRDAYERAGRHRPGAVGHQGQGAGPAGACLLGGPVRQKMRVYSWIGGDRPEGLVEGAKEAQARGFSAIKMLATEELHLSRQPRQAGCGGRARRRACATRWDRISASRWISMAGCIGRWPSSWRRSSIPSI